MSSVAILKDMVYAGLPCKELLGRQLTRNFIARPCFVVGSARSGTTVLGRAMDRHPQMLFSANEAPLGQHVGDLAFRHAYAWNRDWFVDSVAYSVASFEDVLVKLLFESVFGPNWGLRRFAGVLQGGFDLAWHTRSWGTKLFPEKDAAAGLVHLFPDAHFIYILRNPINVIYSMSKFGAFKDMTFNKRCKFWMTTIRRFDHLRQNPRCLTIAFEDLAANPDEIFCTIQKHIGLPFDPAPAQFAKNHVIHPLDQPDSQMNARGLFANRPSSYNEFSAEERGILDKICGEAMAELGYERPQLLAWL